MTKWGNKFYLIVWGINEMMYQILMPTKDGDGVMAALISNG